VKLKKNKERELSALLIKSNNLKHVTELNSLIIIAQGFSDTKESLQRFYIPFMQLGYSILIYDARGTGASKKVGSKGDFLSRINDFKTIVN